MQAFNASMSTVRESVECLFDDIANYFKFVDIKKNLKIGLSIIGKGMLYVPYFEKHLPVCMETIPSRLFLINDLYY